jgi:hypothetical protein
MARGFLTTYGIGATDRIQTSFASHGTFRTYSVWAFLATGAVANSQRIFDKRTSGDTQKELWLWSGAADRFEYTRNWSGGDANWSMPTPSLGVWHHLAVTYDSSATGNAPVMYTDGISQTVTTQAAASGTIGTNTSVYHLGNRGAGDRTWEGMLAEFAVWGRILNQAEIQLLAGRWSPALFAAGLVEYLPLDGTIESKVRGPLKPTTTGTLLQPHPARMIKPTRFRPYFLDRVDWVKQPWKFQGGLGPLIVQ